MAQHEIRNASARRLLPLLLAMLLLPPAALARAPDSELAFDSTARRVAGLSQPDPRLSQPLASTRLSSATPCQPRPRPDGSFYLDCGQTGTATPTAPATMVTGWSPTAPAPAGEVLTVQGQYLSGTEVLLDGAVLETISASASQLELRLPATPTQGALTLRRLSDGATAVLDPAYQTREPLSFAFAHFQPEADSLSLANGYLLAVASFYLYGNQFCAQDESDCPFGERYGAALQSLGMDQVVFVESAGAFPDTQAAVMWNDEVVILAFRGTETGDGGLPPDWVTDAQFLLLPAPAAWAPSELGFSGPMLLHKGFYDALQDVYPELLALVAPRVAEGRRLWVTGHSLGGALAALAAFQLAQVDAVAVEGVHTFGATRVGNFYWALANAFTSYPTWRWVQDGDPITLLPVPSNNFAPLQLSPPLLTYIHVGRVNQLHADGSVDLETAEHFHAPDLLDGLFDEHMRYPASLRGLLDEALLPYMPPTSASALGGD